MITRFRIVIRLLVMFALLANNLLFCEAQTFPIQSLMYGTALSFGVLDSNNYILEEVKDIHSFKKIIHEEFPFSIGQAHRPNDIIAYDTILPILGLHNSAPQFNGVLQEVKGVFAIDTVLKNWYAYKSNSTGDTTTAFVIIPGEGTNQSWAIASAELFNYHNIPYSIRDKCKTHGDVFVFVKPNQDFRAIWTGQAVSYNKFDFTALEPYTDYSGVNWAANMYIESIAMIKSLKMRYQKVIVLGLSNAAIPALVAGMEGQADGTIVAAGLSTETFLGFNVQDQEQPLYYSIFEKYALDSITQRLANPSSYFLFSYGDQDSLTSYEFNTHDLQGHLQNAQNSCYVNFDYSYSYHYFPFPILDSFIHIVQVDSCNTSVTTTNWSQAKNHVLVYPNPAKQLVYIDAKEKKIEQIQLFDIQGKEVLKISNHSAGLIELDISAYPMGNYFINVIGETFRFGSMISKLD